MLTSFDGRTMYAVIVDSEAERLYVYRGRDGQWQRLDPAGTLPWYAAMQQPSYVTPDGTHVVVHIKGGSAQTEEGGLEFFAGKAGETEYRKIADPVGLGGRHHPIFPVSGGFITHTADAIYRSTDGWKWSKITI